MIGLCPNHVTTVVMIVHIKVAFISILARTDRHVDLVAITLPPMEHRFVEEVQLR